MKKGSLCFVANDFDFFFRHFRPAVAAGRARGWQISAVLPPKEGLPPPDMTDLNLVEGPIDRKSNSVVAFARQAVQVATLFRKLRPDTIVVYSLRAGLIVALALPFIPASRVMFCVTGLGILDLAHGLKGALIRTLTYAVMRAASRSSRCHFIFENPTDARKMGFSPQQQAHHTILMGAGVSLSDFVQHPLPPHPPFRFATLSRLVWSKGIDLAVQAISELSNEGWPVELDIYGRPDDENPLPADPHEWSNQPGVTYRGHTDQVNEVWRDHHAAIFASRGGEGLPRVLLEASACGRPSIVTAVSGCVDFVRDGIDGYVVPPESVRDLKQTIIKLVSAPQDIPKLGGNARERVARNSTVEIIQAKYEDLLGNP